MILAIVLVDAAVGSVQEARAETALRSLQRLAATAAVGVLLRAYASRSEESSLFKIGRLSNRWMPIALLTSLGLVSCVLYVPGPQRPFDVLRIGAAAWRSMVASVGLDLGVVAETPRSVRGFRLGSRRCES